MLLDWLFLELLRFYVNQKKSVAFHCWVVKWVEMTLNVPSAGLVTEPDLESEGGSRGRLGLGPSAKLHPFGRRAFCWMEVLAHCHDPHTVPTKGSPLYNLNTQWMLSYLDS